MAVSESLQRIEAVRRFNRFYTRQIGLLREHLLDGPFGLTEARVLYELGQHREPTASQLAEELALDAGYLSRLLAGFQRHGLLARRPSAADRRQQLLSLTEKGEEAFAALNAASRAEVERLLGALAPAEQDRLVTAMAEVERVLGTWPERRPPYLLRPHQCGDMGWVVQSHAELYRREYGWDERFEALVAEIVAEFLRGFDSASERCWIAERQGENVGSVFLVKHPQREGVARLRLLLVDPRARGLGIGKRLVAECTRFARQAGYRRITLWTNSVLDAARAIYRQEGYRLVSEEPHRSFGPQLVGQAWELDLEAPAAGGA